MDKTAFDDYLGKRYYEQVKYYSDVSKKNKRLYSKFQWALIIVSTLSTILAALIPAFSKDDYLKNFPLHYVLVITTGLVTILTSSLKTFQYQELWVNYRSTLEQLKPEIYYYNFDVGDYGKPGQDKETLFVTRIEQILNKEHVEWPAVKKLEDQTRQQSNDEHAVTPAAK
jgi:uncharacterized protein DUF4231